MMHDAAHRGGSFGRIGKVWPRYGIAFACDTVPVESSPVRCVSAARVMLIIIAATLALFGTIALGDGVYIAAKAALAQQLLHTAWDRARSGAVSPRPWPWADTYPIARLLAPAQGVDLFVLAGASGRTLAFGPGHHDGSAQPGEDGNVVLSGHRDTHFRFLRNVHLGDALALETVDGRRHPYRVRSTAIVDYRKLVLSRSADQLTLVTCYPFDAITPGGPLRYVVIATPDDQVKESRKPRSGSSP